jgi:hypothetical protein
MDGAPNISFYGPDQQLRQHSSVEWNYIDQALRKYEGTAKPQRAGFVVPDTFMTRGPGKPVGPKKNC